MYEPLSSAVVLSRGSAWAPQPQDPPYLVADPTRPWPTDADAFIRFYDTKGAPLIDDTYADDVSASRIQFAVESDVMDTIPQGANFEIFVDTAEGVFQIRHGKVIRREVEFFDSPALTSTYQALQFTDSFPTLGLRSSWVRIKGKPVIRANGSLPNGLGASNSTNPAVSKLAVRWFAPLNGDSARSKVVLLNQHTGGTGHFATTRVYFCGDQRFTTGLGVQFSHSQTDHLIRFFSVAGGPFSQTYQGVAIDAEVADGEDYTAFYDDSTHTVGVYKGTDLTTLGSWQDTTGLVPHGPGYRYPGLVFENGPSTNGIEVAYWTAKDDV